MGAFNCRHDVAAEGRPGLQQYPVLVPNLQLGAIGGQTGGQGGCHQRNEGTADGRGPCQNNLRLLVPDNVLQDVAVDLVGEIFKGRIIYLVDNIGTIGDKLPGAVAEIAAYARSHRKAAPAVAGR